MVDGPGAVSGERDASGRVMPTLGRRVGHYEIVRQIGRGGMAIVYLARQETLDRDVALKELSSFHASSPDMAQRFLREARLAGALNHPNIVTVLDHFEDGGVPYIAMEYVPRGSLRPYVGQLSFAQFAGVMEGVLAGLAHAESYGIVHRDLKPENLMITADGRVKIADFGIAKATQSAGTGAFLTATGTTVGTPTYMAPEQAMGQDIGMWTDLYSVGVMAWEHVVGHVPFHDSEAPMVILMRHVNEQVPSAIEVNPDADPDLSAWIDRLLLKDVSRRTRSPAVAWEELEELIIQKLGPRWRREARLPSHTALLDTPRPLTPAPFESQRARTPKPVSRPSPEPLREDSGYVTFGPPGEPGERELPAPPEAAPEAAETAAEPPGPVVHEVAAPEHEQADVAESPPAVAADELPESPVPTYLTFGGTPEARVPVEEPVDSGAIVPLETSASLTEPEPLVEPEPAAAVEAASVEPVAPVEPAETPAAEAEPLIDEPTELKREVPATSSAAPEPLAVAAVPAEVAEPRLPAPVADRLATRPRAPTAMRLVAFAIGCALAAAAAGFLLAPSAPRSRSLVAPLSQTASAGPIQISLPSGWQRAAAPAAPALKLANVISLAPAKSGSGAFVIGTATTTDPTLLPSSLLSALPSAPTGQVVTLGHHQFFRYLNLAPRGVSAPEVVYALPTTLGTVIATCQPQAAAPSFPSDCERILGTILLRGGTVLGLGPDQSFAAELTQVVTALDTAAARSGARLAGARTPRDQASAARDLAKAYTQAASAIRHLVSGPAADGARAALAAALDTLGGDYARLARAAAHNDKRGYDAASSAIASAGGVVSSAFAGLAKLGYVAS